MGQTCSCGEKGDIAGGNFPVSFCACRLDETIEAMNRGTLSEPARSPEAKTTLGPGVLVNPRLLQPAPLVSVG